MKYPTKLKPNRIEKYSFEGEEYAIPVVDLSLRQWLGEPISNTFGGKPLIDYKGKPMFAELAVQRIAAESEGWASRWVETYACKRSGPYYFMEWIEGPLTQQVTTSINNKYLEKIILQTAEANGNSYSGCWDVLAWQDKRPLFIELKRNRKDSVRSTQLKWLKAALDFGLTLDNFLIVQWDFE